MPKKERKSLTETSYVDQLSSVFYTPQEAQRRLGMDRDRFNNLVRNHVVGRHLIPGSQSRFHFLRKEIDALAEQYEAIFMTAESPDYNYRFAMHSDLKALDDMAYMNFGEGAYKPERTAARKRFLEANPYSTIVMLDHEVVVASLDIVPLKHEAIIEFREGKRGWQFPNEVIEQFESGRRLEVIIIDMMTTTRVAMDQRQRYSADLLLYLGRKTLPEWGHKGINIKSIDACGGTALGKRILKRAGFISLGSKAGGTRDMYMLDVDQSNLDLLKPYKAALAEWKTKQ